MEASQHISVHEYLNSSYRPDCDYIEGQLIERNLGLRSHAVCVGNLSYIFYLNRAAWQVIPLISQRIRISEQRIRVADLCVISRADTDDDIVSNPPALCIEVLSPEDTMTELQERVNDYATMGVQNIWAVDPWKRLAYYCSARGFQQPEDGFFRVGGTPIEVALSAVFAELDQAE